MWINNGHNWTNDSSWVFPIYGVSGAGATDEGLRFADVNKDGFIDVLRSRPAGSEVYINTGHGWNLSTMSIPVMFAGGGGVDVGTRLSDVNGDGYTDIVQRNVSGEGFGVYLFNGTGWKIEDRTIPDAFLTATGADGGVRLVDVNGDGLDDFLRSIGSDQRTYLNDGVKWVRTDLFPIPVMFTSASTPDTGARFADINNDGLIDILVDFANATISNRSAWINTGKGWVRDDRWQAPIAFTVNGLNVDRRLADVNGDSFVDIIIGREGNMTQTWIRNQTTPPLLKSITNEYGGVTQINYSRSTLYNNSENYQSGLGFTIYVVTNVTTNNSLTGEFGVFSSTSYNYSFGKFDSFRSEFRGFGIVTEQKPLAVVSHYFHQDARKGKEFQTEIYGDKLMSKEFRMYQSTNTSGVFNVTLDFVSKYLNDGNESPKVTNTTFAYDAYGNAIAIIEFGEVGVADDYRTTSNVYAHNRDDWIVDRLVKSSVYDSEDKKIRETTLFYDNSGYGAVQSHGALTKQEQWNNFGNNTFAYFEYDDFWNVIRTTDSLGNSQSTFYDGSHTYPVTAVNALGHVSTATYELGTGNVLTRTANDITTRFTYDVFGRISKEVMPYDTELFPTKSYNYLFDGRAPEVVQVRAKTTANNTEKVRYYYDGFGQLVQLKSDIEDSQQVVKNLFYDRQGRVSSEQNPYFSAYTNDLTAVSGTDAKIFYNYDALDRVIGVKNADGTSKNITFDRWNISDFNENGVRHVYQLDGYDRIVAVFEFNNDTVTGANETYLTTYSYDGNDNLNSIVDTAGNEFVFGYDSLGRKISMNDPDLGGWVYKYDSNGNLILQAGSNGGLITGDGYFREYNDFGQLTKTRNGSNASSPALEEYFYDPDGQRVKIKRNDSANTTVYTPYKEMQRIVNATGTYDFYYIYHDGNLVARKNPDHSVTYFHPDHLGSTSIITNNTGQVIENTTYSPYGEEVVGGSEDSRGYTGQFDDETEQMYFGARYYLPNFGLWVSADPLIQNAYDPQFLNHYAYVRANPYKLIDPDGREVVVAVRHTELPLVGDAGHISLVVRNPDAGAQSSYNYYSDQGPNTLDTGLKFYFNSFSGKYYSDYETNTAESITAVLPNSHYDSFTIQTSPEQERQIISKAEQIISNPQKYYAATRNSQDFVIEVLESGSIELDRKLFPRNTFYSNKDTFVYNTYNIFEASTISGVQSANRGGSRSNNGQAEALRRHWEKQKNKRGG